MRRRRSALSVLAGFLAGAATLAAALAAGCSSGGEEPRAEDTPSTSGTQASKPVSDGPSTTVVAAGDIGSCSSSGDEATAKLIEKLDPDAVLALGDEAYESGTPADFRRCYDPTWGRFKDKTYPVPGNHEYRTKRASAYFDYFGERAGTPAKPYYSFDLGDWHFLALDSNIAVDRGSAQLRWLRDDLASDDHVCELAFWHHPRWSGGRHDSQEFMDPVWRLLAEERVDVVLAAHDHNYQRFFKLDADGERAEDGVRSFVVGTGGASHYETDDVAHRVSASDDLYGVLELTLRPESYDFEFVPVRPASFSDSMTNRRCT